jgi:hypothetical protein
MFVTLCTVIGDTSIAAMSLAPETRSDGTEYFRQNFDIVLLFGLTELKAQLSWKENVGSL